MTTSDYGLALIKSCENCRLKAYPDSTGILTIGWGHTAGVRAGDTCTQEQAYAWLKEDVESAADFVANSVDVELTQGQFDALTSFVYNLGARKFKYSTLRVLIQSGQMERAALEFPKWNHAGGKVEDGLTRRRYAEACLFLGYGDALTQQCYECAASPWYPCTINGSYSIVPHPRRVEDGSFAVQALKDGKQFPITDDVIERTGLV